MTVRHSSASRYSRETRPPSLLSAKSAHRHSGSTINEEIFSSNRHSGTFVDLRRPRSMCEQDPAESDRSSIISSSSASTLSSWNASELNGVPEKMKQQPKSHLSSVQRVESPIVMLPRPSSSASSSGSSIRTGSPGGKSPHLGDRRSPQPPESPLLGDRRSPRSSPPLQQDGSTSSLDSLVTHDTNLMVYGTPV